MKIKITYQKLTQNIEDMNTTFSNLKKDLKETISRNLDNIFENIDTKFNMIEDKLLEHVIMKMDNRMCDFSIMYDKQSHVFYDNEIKAIESILEVKVTDIKADVEVATLKMSKFQVNKFATSHWWLQDDLEQYPLLKSSIQDNNHWSKFKYNLETLTLHTDSLLELERFWNTIDNAFMTTLNMNLGIKKYA